MNWSNILKVKKRLRTRKVITKSIPSFSPSDIKAIRVNIKLSQKVLAEVVDVSSKTVEAWEQGKNKPNGSSARMLQTLSNNPEIILKEITEESNEKE